MKYRISILTLILFLTVLGCQKDWDAHYYSQPETVDQNVWEAIQSDPKISEFVNYDTLFQTDRTYTIFIPVNEALIAYRDTGLVDTTLLNYHIAEQFVQANVVSGKRQIQTLSRKFALLENYGTVTLLDGVEMDFESPLYRNGKYYLMSQVAEPKPNLYEYISRTNPILRRYIDEQDSIVLDKEKSRPIGFDENGNTIYDTVAQVINMFEEEYFPIKHEFRTKAATLAFPVSNVYNNALSEMAQNLGYVDYNDIPYDWQENVLIPELLYQGVFDNRIEESEFFKKYERDSVKLKNVLGDSVGISYTPVDKTICSNGYAYSYSDYTIPDSLYLGGYVFEGEWLMRLAGLDKYSWKKESNVKIVTDTPIEPGKKYVGSASRDSILSILLPLKYKGQFEFSFQTEMSIFPRKYLMVIRTNIYTGGIYDIYVNGELVRTFDYYDYTRYRGIYTSVTGERIYKEGTFNYIDCWVENIWEYSRPEIKFVYKEPGFVSNNGLIIDFVEFIPEDSWNGYVSYLRSKDYNN